MKHPGGEKEGRQPFSKHLSRPERRLCPALRLSIHPFCLPLAAFFSTSLTAEPVGGETDRSLPTFIR